MSEEYAQLDEIRKQVPIGEIWFVRMIGTQTLYVEVIGKVVVGDGRERKVD